MPDEDPNRPPGDFGKNLGDQIHREVHDRMYSRMEERRQRWEAKMERRRLRFQGAGMSGFHLHGASGGLVVGLILAAVGVVLLLQNLNILPDQDLWEFWPVIFIVAGITRAVSSYSLTGRALGGIVALGGVLFLLSNLNFIHRDMWTFFWPVVLMLAGAFMLMRGMERNHYLDQKRAGSTPGSSPNQGTGPFGTPPNASPIHRVHEFAIFGGANRRVDSQEFEGGDAVAMFGGVQIDLRKAETKLPEVNIDVTAAFGGVEIKVPETWAVNMRVTSIFGGYDDKTHVPPPGPKPPTVLVVTGAVIFGGLSVKN